MTAGLLLDRPECTVDDAEEESGSELMNASTLTGLAAVLFGCGLVTLFAALYRGGTSSGPLLWVGLGLLIATILCWLAAARAQRTASRD